MGLSYCLFPINNRAILYKFRPDHMISEFKIHLWSYIMISMESQVYVTCTPLSQHRLKIPSSEEHIHSAFSLFSTLIFSLALIIIFIIYASLCLYHLSLLLKSKINEGRSFSVLFYLLNKY